MDLEIVHAKSNKPLVTIPDQCPEYTVQDVKKNIAGKKPKYRDINRQELRLEPRGKPLKDEESLASLGLKTGAMLYFKDRGLQIGWTTVFLCEYAGPLLAYVWFTQRPWLAYGDLSNDVTDLGVTQKIAMAAWVGHYAKRLLETMFIHRFSNATMPITNLFKNCGYYWGFAAYISYHVNHPLFTSPCSAQVFSCLAVFVFCELGNFSCHLLFRNLRPAGSKERKIPVPDGNPLTALFSLVSCPNYTYEVGAWLSFTVMTQCLPAGLFAVAGAYQMTMWALGKHRNYQKEFKDYPRRKAIIPFLL
jgi:very-long-chain enoyl-CoA reductase